MRFTRLGLIVSAALAVPTAGSFLILGPDRPPAVHPGAALAAADVLRVVDRRDGEEISITFDRPMVEPEAVGHAAPLEVDLPGRAVWTSLSRAEFRREGPLPPGRTVSVRMAGVSALDGKRLAGPVQWSFRSPGFAVTGGSLPGTTGPRPRFELRFNRPVEPATLERHARFESGDRSVAAFLIGDALVPEEPLPLGSSWMLVLHEDLHSEDGLRLDPRWFHSFRVAQAQDLVSAAGASDVHGTNRIRLKFANPVIEKELRPRLDVHPRVRFEASVWAEDVELWGDFKAGQAYWVHLKDGIADLYGNRMGPRTATVQVPSYDPSVHLEERRVYLERAGSPAVPLECVNVPGVRVTVSRIAPDPWRKQEGDLVYERIFEGNTEPDEIFTHGIALPGAGIYRVEASAPAVRQAASDVYQVTDLALSFKLGLERSLAVVTSFDSAQSCEGVDVSLHDAKGGILWAGRTGPDGCAEAPGRPSLAGEPRYLVGRRADDQAWLDLSRSELSTWRLPLDERRPGETLPLDLYLHTDRPLYRPGETVHVKGWWKSPAAADARLEVRDPRGDLLERRTCAASPAGGIDASFRLGSHASTGTYRIAAIVGDRASHHSVEVGTYRPPSFEVKVRPSSPHCFPKDKLIATVEARAFFGAPLSGALVRWYARIEERGEHASGEGTLDAEGRFSVAYPLGKGTGPLTLHATVTDAANQSIGAEAVVQVHPSALRVEARTSLLHGEAGKPLPVDVGVRNLDGAPQDREVSLRLVKRTWSSVQQLTAGHGWTYVWEKRDALVSAEIVRPGGAIVTPREPGVHVLEFRTRDDAGREAFTSLEIDVTGPGEAGWFQRNDRRVDLSADKALYRAGDVARILVRHAPPGSRALVTLEREGVLERRWRDLPEPTCTLEIPIGPSHAPNVHVGALVFRGRTEALLTPEAEDIGGPRMRYGYVTLPVDTSDRRLPVEVKTEPRCLPGGEAVVEVRTLPGAEIALAVVDEAVLSLLDAADPDPHHHFWGPRPLRVASFDAHPDLAALRPLDIRGKKGHPGGDGGGEKGVRRNFASTAHWSAGLLADEAGLATVRFRLPDNLTRWRAVAVAGVAGRWGTGHARFESDKPLMLVPALPRFALLGDRFDARFVVHNRTGGAGVARVEFGGESREVPVDPGRSAAFDFPVRAERLGPWRFSARARLGGRDDRVEVTIPVVFPAATETVTASGWIRGAGEPTLPGLDRVESVLLALGTNELALMDSELRRLLDYPHGCVEQTTSKTLPLLALQALRLEGAGDRARSGLQRLLSMQTPSGGLAYWPGESEAHPSGSVYAAHALVLGERAALGVPRPALDRLLDYLEARLKEPDSCRRSYAVYVLALAGRRHEAYVEALPPDSYLALAALEMGKLTRARAILHGPIDVRAPGEFESDARAEAVRVMAKVRLGEDPGVAPADLVRRAVLTYERAWTLLAAGELVRATTGGRKVKVWVDGILVAERAIDGVERLELPHGRLRIESDGPVFYALQVRGQRKAVGEGSGFWVRRAYTRAGEEEPRTRFRAGDLVVVRVSVYANAERAYVALEDPLPAGFEPVDLRFRGGDGSFVGVDDFDHVDRRDDRVFASNRRMERGLYELTYLVRATAVGSFTAPAPRAEEMYAPHVQGRGRDAAVEVIPR